MIVAGEGVGMDGSGARGRGMPLEGLQFGTTPVGMHFTVSRFDIPWDLDPRMWTLQVLGAVRQPLELDLGGLRGRGERTVPVTIECADHRFAGAAVSTATWTGVPLATLLAEAGPAPDAASVVFTGADRGVVNGGVEHHYEQILPLADALAPDVLVAYDMDGMSLPVQHGFPARLVVPGRYGVVHVKWLAAITVSTAPALDVIHAVAPRALIAPPGVADAASSTRYVELGEHELAGQAWSGAGPVTAVEISCDGGATWVAAELLYPLGDWTWRRWYTRWTVTEPGRYELLARATDAHGNVQPAPPDRVVVVAR